MQQRLNKMLKPNLVYLDGTHRIPRCKSRFVRRLVSEMRMYTVGTHMTPLGPHCRIAALPQRNNKNGRSTPSRTPSDPILEPVVFSTPPQRKLAFCSTPRKRNANVHCRNPHDPTRTPLQNSRTASTEQQKWPFNTITDPIGPHPGTRCLFDTS